MLQAEVCQIHYSTAADQLTVNMYPSQCVDRLDLIGCSAANAFCETEFIIPFVATGRNAYDISAVGIRT